MTEFLKKLSYPELFQKIRIPVIIIFLSLSVFSIFNFKNLKLDFGFHSLFERCKDLPALERYRKLYGEDINLIIITIKAEDIFNRTVLSKIASLTEFTKNQPEVEKVTSLTDVEIVRSSEDEVSVEPFLKHPLSEITDEELKKLREEALSSRQLKRFLISDNASVTAVIIELKGHLRNQNRLIGAIEKWILDEKQNIKKPNIEFYPGGVNVIQREYESAAKSDMITNGILIYSVMTIILALLYRNLIGIILPLLSSLISLAIILGLMAITKEPITLVTQLVPELTIILGIADGVYIISRFLEEKNKNHQGKHFFQKAMEAMIVACFFTSLTTSIGFGSCVIAEIYIIRRFGIFIAIAVGISFLSVILFVPSIISFIYPLKVIQKPHIHQKNRTGVKIQKASQISKRVEKIINSFLQWNVNAVLNHGKIVIIISLIIVIVSLFFSFKIKVQHRLLSEISEDNPVSLANKFFENHLFGILSFGVEFEGPPDSMIEPDVLKKIDYIARILEKDKTVRKINSLPGLLKEFNMKWMGEGEKYYSLPETRKLAAQYMEFFDPALKRMVVSDDYSKTRISIMTQNVPSTWWIETMNKLKPVLEKQFPAGGKIKWNFNGSSHLAVKVLHHLMAEMFSTMITSLLAITICMLILFRSLKLGLISMIPNAIPILVTAGFMGAAGIELRPATSIIFAVSLGIAVNDTIHLMTRFKEELLGEKDVREAVKRTIISVGKPVIYTSILLIFGYIVLLRAKFIAVRDFSLLFTVTIATALICDLFLTSLLFIYFIKVKNRGS